MIATAPDYATFDLGDGRELCMDYEFEVGIGRPERAYLVISVLANGQCLSRLAVTATASFTEPQRISVGVYYDAITVEFGRVFVDGRCGAVYFPGPADVNGYRGSTADRIADWLNPKAGVDVRMEGEHLRRLTPEEHERFYAHEGTESEMELLL